MSKKFDNKVLEDHSDESDCDNNNMSSNDLFKTWYLSDKNFAWLTSGSEMQYSEPISLKFLTKFLPQYPQPTTEIFLFIMFFKIYKH